jgi:hypothetical protein
MGDAVRPGEMSTAEDPIDRANDRIRDTAKWLIACVSAVGAALIAGSQLSGIGRLPLGWPVSVEHARLWIATVSLASALCGAAYAIRAAVPVLLPVFVPISDLAAAWTVDRGPLHPVVAFFRRDPKYLQGFATPHALIEARTALVERLHGVPDAASGGTAEDRTDRITDLNRRIAELDRRISVIEQTATFKALAATFGRALRVLFVAAAVASVGMVGFAWAANPPAPAAGADLRGARLVGADLRDADLRGARLDNADLADADLTGADLRGASVHHVTWRNTVCPDGTNSDRAGNTCAGHLS